MAYELYKANVQSLCDRLHIPNPIQEDDLKIGGLKFYDYSGGPGKTISWGVEGTDMNRAGRLFIQHSIPPFSFTSIRQEVREAAAAFFTSEMWDDCGPEKRLLIYGLKTASWIEISYKH